MNWILGLIGAVFGAAMAGERGLFGTVAGFLLVYLLGALNGLKSRLQRCESDLNVLRLRLAELTAPAPVATPGAVASAQREGAAPIQEDAAESVHARVMQDLRARQAERDAASTQWERPTTGSAPKGFVGPRESTPQPIPTRPTAPREPPKPGWDEKITAAIKRWFTEGNVPVKIGVLVLFAGVAAALRYAAAQGYFTLPIEVRLALIAGGALVAPQE